MAKQPVTTDGPEALETQVEPPAPKAGARMPVPAVFGEPPAADVSGNLEVLAAGMGTSPASLLLDTMDDPLKELGDADEDAWAGTVADETEEPMAVAYELEDGEWVEKVVPLHQAAVITAQQMMDSAEKGTNVQIAITPERGFNPNMDYYWAHASDGTSIPDAQGKGYGFVRQADIARKNNYNVTNVDGKCRITFGDVVLMCRPKGMSEAIHRNDMLRFNAQMRDLGQRLGDGLRSDIDRHRPGAGEAVQLTGGDATRTNYNGQPTFNENSYGIPDQSNLAMDRNMGLLHQVSQAMGNQRLAEAIVRGDEVDPSRALRTLERGSASFGGFDGRYNKGAIGDSPTVRRLNEQSESGGATLSYSHSLDMARRLLEQSRR